jgi:hypothetical protein
MTTLNNEGEVGIVVLGGITSDIGFGKYHHHVHTNDYLIYYKIHYQTLDGVRSKKFF